MYYFSSLKKSKEFYLSASFQEVRGPENGPVRPIRLFLKAIAKHQTLRGIISHPHSPQWKFRQSWLLMWCNIDNYCCVTESWVCNFEDGHSFLSFVFWGCNNTSLTRYLHPNVGIASPCKYWGSFLNFLYHWFLESWPLFHKIALLRHDIRQIFYTSIYLNI